MNTLKKRSISAVIVILACLAVTHFFGAQGVFFFGFALCTVGIFEYQKMVFSKYQAKSAMKWFFIAVCATLLATGGYAVSHRQEIWGVLIAVYFAVSLWLMRGRSDNENLLAIIGFSGLGFLYCGLLPAFALSLLTSHDGAKWFLFLLVTVFAGDIFAYFGGTLLGKTRLMPLLSPNKTLAGAVSGILGSTICGSVFHFYGLEFVSLGYLIVVAALSSALAQNGDLFESLIKRVAAVKDSGHFMPGHGGVLDRLDGIYFAAPVVFAASQVLS